MSQYYTPSRPYYPSNHTQSQEYYTTPQPYIEKSFYGQQAYPTNYVQYPTIYEDVRPPPSLTYTPLSYQQTSQYPPVNSSSIQPVSYSQQTPVQYSQTIQPSNNQVEYSQSYPVNSQLIQSSYQPVYQGQYERELVDFPEDRVYRGPTYLPVDREELERRWSEEMAFQSERERDLEYLKWKSIQQNRIIASNLEVPGRPQIPLASTFVLQPYNYSDIRQTISHYDSLSKFSTEEKFKSMKNEISRSSYTYSQMINTLLHNFKENLLALQEIEKCKTELINREDFSIRLFYFALNNNYTDKILTSDQLKLAMETLNFPMIELSDIQLLFAKYSNERSCEFLTLNDFKKLFIPFYINERRKYELDSRENLKEISLETQRIAARVIRMHMNLENSQEYSRQLMQRRLIDLAYCFDYIDRERRGVLNQPQVQVFLQSNEVYCNPEDTNLLIQRFNNAFPIGPLQEHVITLSQFIYELTPKSSFPYYKEQ